MAGVEGEPLEWGTGREGQGQVRGSRWGVSKSRRSIDNACGSPACGKERASQKYLELLILSVSHFTSENTRAA